MYNYQVRFVRLLRITNYPVNWNPIVTFVTARKAKRPKRQAIMSTKFFNNIETRLMDKFHGIASAMANFDIFHAVVGYFRSSGYFKLRKELENVTEIRILVGINIDNLFRQSQLTGKFFFENKEATLEQYCEDFLRDVYQSEYSSEVDEGIRQFCADIANERLQLRIHPTKDLHAKFYLCLPKKKE